VIKPPIHCLDHCPSCVTSESSGQIDACIGVPIRDQLENVTEKTPEKAGAMLLYPIWLRIRRSLECSAFYLSLSIALPDLEVVSSVPGCVLIQKLD
jgi:hypothetical protein